MIVKTRDPFSDLDKRAQKRYNENRKTGIFISGKENRNMNEKPYTVGVDFGTLSARAILLDTRDGREVKDAVFVYPHGVMEDMLPDGTKLPPLYALQDPDDYLLALKKTVPALFEGTGVNPAEVAAIGIDFTSCTVLPVDKDGVPLCRQKRFASDPQAYVKLWKHHGAQEQADRMTAAAGKYNEPWLGVFGGRVSSEAFFPKILEVLERSPAVFAAAERFMEAGDWISLCLTGNETHSIPFAGYKAFWTEENGYPSDAFLRALHPGLAGIVGTKIPSAVSPLVSNAGKLNRAGAELTGLLPGTAAALPMIDAHAAMPALGITGNGDMMIILGTSACHILNSETETAVPGICGYVKNGVIPGLVTYEAGQSSSGDCFDWFVKRNVPEDYRREAEARGIGIHQLLREKAERLRPGESGLLALDWLGGNRSILSDASLTGMMLGMTMQTKPEEQYRAWIEATAYGTRKILENYEEHGIAVNSITAAGGIAAKDPMLMQIYADVTKRPIAVAGSTQAAARGSAIYAAAAGGLFRSIPDACERLALPPQSVYTPDPAASEVYDELYDMYQTLHDYFGRREDSVMRRLSALRNSSAQKTSD